MSIDTDTIPLEVYFDLGVPISAEQHSQCSIFACTRAAQIRGICRRHYPQVSPNYRRKYQQ